MEKIVIAVVAIGIKIMKQIITESIEYNNTTTKPLEIFV